MHKQSGLLVISSCGVQSTYLLVVIERYTYIIRVPFGRAC